MKLSAHDAVEDAIASVRLAGLTVSSEGRAILERYASGEITLDTAKKIILDQAKERARASGTSIL